MSQVSHIFGITWINSASPRANLATQRVRSGSLIRPHRLQSADRSASAEKQDIDSIVITPPGVSRNGHGSRGGCSVRKCFGVRESRPYSGRRSPKSCRFFLLFAWQKLFFHDFSPTAPTLRGFVA